MATATNKKPGPAQPPSKPGHKPAPAAKKPKAGGQSVVVRVSSRVERAREMAQNQYDKIKNWPGDRLIEARSHLTIAIDNLRQSAEVLAALPGDYKPRPVKGAGATIDLLPNALVDVADKRLEKWEGGSIKKEHLRGMTVLEVVGPQVWCRLNASEFPNNRTLFPRGHLIPHINREAAPADDVDVD